MPPTALALPSAHIWAKVNQGMQATAVRRPGRAADVARTPRWGAAGARAMQGVGRTDASGLGTIGSA